MGIVRDKQKMKKEMNKINIIKFSKILILSCFSFLTFFSFSYADTYEQIYPILAGNYNTYTTTPLSVAPSQFQSGTCDSNALSGTYPNMSVMYTSNGGACTIMLNASFWAGLGGGTYWIRITKAGTTDWIYWQITNGIVPNPPPDNTTTRIVLISPENNATTTSPVELEVEYYINSTTHDNLEKLFVDFSLINGILVSGTQGINLEIENIVYDTLMTATTSIALPDNQIYSWNARMVVNEDNCNNPLLSIVWCAFQSATSRSIASSANQNFVIGNNPLDSIENFGNSLFDASGIDSNLLGGGCAFVATSTCDISSPTTYGGCFTNSLVVVLCPSVNTINYATTTLMNTFYSKMPFGFFTQPYVKISELVNSTSTTLGDNVVVNIDVLGNASTTIFSWSEAKNFMDNSIGEGVINTLMIIELVGLTFYCFYRLIGLGKNNDNTK